MGRSSRTQWINRIELTEDKSVTVIFTLVNTILLCLFLLLIHHTRLFSLLSKSGLLGGKPLNSPRLSGYINLLHITRILNT